MNKLYNIFDNERKRYPDMTVFYREGNDRMEKSLSYSNDDGRLTILFGKNGEEDFYFRKPDEKGLGDIVQTLSNKGNDKTRHTDINMLMESEQKRHPDMIIYRPESEKGEKHLKCNYDESLLCYSNNEGTLSVLFHHKSGVEEFYFRKPDEKGLGDIVQTLSDKGMCGEMPHINSLLDLPDGFREIAQSYQFDRNAVGLDTDALKIKLPDKFSEIADRYEDNRKEIGIDKGRYKHNVER